MHLRAPQMGGVTGSYHVIRHPEENYMDDVGRIPDTRHVGFCYPVLYSPVLCDVMESLNYPALST